MLFTCPANAARGGGPRSRAGGRRPFCVDIHCHVHHPAADEMVKHLFSPDREPSARFSTELSRATNRKQMENAWSGLTSAEQRLPAIDTIDAHAPPISPSPSHALY